MLRSVVVILTMIISLTVQADDQARLDQIKAEIKKLQSWLTEAREENDELQQRLRKSDQEIAAQIKEIDVEIRYHDGFLVRPPKWRGKTKLSPHFSP
ncbi:MAG: hypothetical protein VX281_07445 [Pseudomonadota bacterium]|nr:hypothetical protein [Pseudomonadota bacterium]